MNKLPLFVIGVLFTFAFSWLGLVVYPFIELGHMVPAPDEDTGGYFPPTLSGSAIAGQRVYAANGCLYCHSQQVRPASLSTDIAKDLGPSLAPEGLRWKSGWFCSLFHSKAQSVDASPTSHQCS